MGKGHLESSDMQSNDLTFTLMLEAGLIPYILHRCAVGSAQVRIFFFLQSLCVLVSVHCLWFNLAVGPLQLPRLLAEKSFEASHNDTC